jgi:hypothetical protein
VVACSGLDDRNASFQRIIAYLIGVVRSKIDEDMYKIWTREVALKIFDMWSTKLGGGLKDTDAKDDDRAWLAISRTVQCLGDNHDNFACRDVQFQLARCAIVNAYVDSEKDNTDSQTDWLSTDVAESLEEWNVSNDMQKQHFWIALASASAIISKLASSFPDDNPTKCLSVIECSIMCISIAVSDLSRQMDLTRYQQESKEESFQMGNCTQVAIGCALGQFEGNADRISRMCRSRMMQNKCFPLASSVMECLKSYTKLVKTMLALPDRSHESRQSTLDGYFDKEH